MFFDVSNGLKDFGDAKTNAFVAVGLWKLSCGNYELFLKKKRNFFNFSEKFKDLKSVLKIDLGYFGRSPGAHLTAETCF